MSQREARPEWYREWFGEEYLALYPHRDQEEARDAVDLVLRSLGRPRGRILDLACGAGRHLTEFAEHELDAVGLDLSATLLARARSRRSDLQLVRSDMRWLPFADDAFELVVNFFTSFGYFSEPDDDRRVLEEIRRVLVRGGRFALDFLNAERVRSGLVEREERELNGMSVIQERRLEEGSDVVVKKIQILDPADPDTTTVFQERVRLYSEEELVELLHAVGLEPLDRFGDYSGSPFDDRSPRLIIIGHRQ